MRLATITQFFNMNDTETDQRTIFLGHISDIHKNSYRLPDDGYYTAKISKLLLLMGKDDGGQFEGKSFNKIIGDMEENFNTSNMKRGGSESLRKN